MINCKDCISYAICRGNILQSIKKYKQLGYANYISQSYSDTIHKKCKVILRTIPDNVYTANQLKSAIMRCLKITNKDMEI